MVVVCLERLLRRFCCFALNLGRRSLLLVLFVCWSLLSALSWGAQRARVAGMAAMTCPRGPCEKNSVRSPFLPVNCRMATGATKTSVVQYEGAVLAKGRTYACDRKGNTTLNVLSIVQTWRVTLNLAIRRHRKMPPSNAEKLATLTFDQVDVAWANGRTSLFPRAGILESRI